VQRIVSGGQTGVDRAALDVALDLRETASPEYPMRTERNVRDSDATLLLHDGRKGRGTALTARCAQRLRRPLREVDLRRPSVTAVREWLAAGRFRTLNVAGPRESESPGIGARAAAFLRDVLSP
jgi:hypothetical protein